MHSVGFSPSEVQVAPQAGRSFLPLPRIGWGIFLLLVLIGVVVVDGQSAGGLFIAGTCLAFLFALRFPYLAFYVYVATSLLLGWQVTLSTGAFEFGAQVFQGSIDVTVAEVIALAVLGSWMVRVLLLWRGRRDLHWQPWLPLFVPFLTVVASQVVSAFSAADPPAVLVLKYALRPVFFVYLSSVLLSVNFIRSKRRLVAALGVLSAIGAWFAFDGLRSLFVTESGLFALQRARPLPFLGMNLLGGNHNSLAEVLLIAAPAALAVAALSKEPRARVFAVASAAFMALIALFTFARSAWIALAVQCLLVGATIGRGWIAKHRQKLAIAAVLFLPLMAYMVRFSLDAVVQGSTDTRAMITGIAWNLFRSSPWIGIGAGTFVDQVSHVFAYVVEFGAPVDAHGVLQKLGAETGILGVAAFAIVMGMLLRALWQAWQGMRQETAEGEAYIFLVAGVLGALVYQFFDTTYWTPRLWLPVGLALAAGRLFLKSHAEQDPNFLAYD
jgi:O-antigen ligase